MKLRAVEAKRKFEEVRVASEPKRNHFSHFILRVVVWITQMISSFIATVILWNHKLLFMPLNTASPAEQWQTIHRTSEQIKKAVPKHVCLAIVDSAGVNIECVSRIAIWCHALGVKFISFFDAAGTLRESAEVLEKELHARLFECRQTKDSIVFLHPGEEVQSLDSDENTSFARVLDIYDGQETVGSVVAKILNDALKAKEKSAQTADFTLEEIENQLSVAGAHFPNPECVLCFGFVNSTMGFLPWQLNHAEIIKVESHHSVQPSQFLRALERYTKIEKRFGK